MLEGGSRDEFNGNYLVSRLGDMKSPVEGKHAEKKKFLEIQQMVRELLHNDEIELDIVHSGTPKLMIEDKSTELRLPIESYGTGLHELVILAAATKLFSNCVFCIEEPEIHMHPGLQKEFVKFINDDESENIYIISTHSNAFIDTIKNPMIFHVRLVNGDTVVNTVKNTADTLHAIHDLGVKASDILQTNGIIWVEGPSDQIYIKKWLELLDPNLREGRDYSIMFYGGSLLNYISLDDNISEYTELNEFIELLSINQNSYIIMDRDKNNSSEYKGASKKRIINECKNSDLGYWLTHEREIENYIPLRIFRNLIKEKYDGKLTLNFPPFKKLEKINYKSNNGKTKLLDYSGRKPHYARMIVDYFDTEMFDEKPPLKSEIDKIISSIKKWNDYEDRN